MAGYWLFLLRLAGVVLAAAAAPQVQTVGAAPGASVQVQCEGSSAPGGGGWNLLDVLSNLLLGGGDDYDDEDDDDEDSSASSSEQRAGSGSDEDEDSWWDLGLFDDSSSEEAARREPPLPDETTNNSLPDEVPNNSLPDEVANNSLADEVANNSLADDVANSSLPDKPANKSLLDERANGSLPRPRRAAPNWGLGDIDVRAGSDWSVRVFNWLLVRRNPDTDRVQVKLLLPNGFSPGATGDDDHDVDDGSGTREARAAAQPAGNMDVQGGKNWSVRVFDWVLVRRNPTTGQVEVKLNVPGLFSPAGGGDDADYVDASGSLREATPRRSEAGAGSVPEEGPEGAKEDGQPAAS